jgi:hypothetical protein
MASTNTQQQTQTMKLPPKDAQLQGFKPIKQNTTQNLMTMLKRKPLRARAQL